ncbi:MAG: hypothetical protein QM820_06315 [Minicystis sp.]
MAKSTFHSTDQKVSLEEFIDFVERNVDVRDDDSVMLAAPMLEALANNKDLLIDVYNKELLSYDAARGAAYSPASAVLGRGSKFVVRANLWPPTAGGAARTVEESLFSYATAHDHNFSFLTANYFGPGYETEIWEYADRSSMIGYVGERVPLVFLERTRLHSGKQIFYRRCRDIHVQFAPPTFSVSINLMMPSAQDIITDQFVFDLAKQQVVSHPDGCPASRRVFLMEVAGALGNDRTAEVLLGIASSHPCARTRASALRGALKIRPESGGGAPCHDKGRLVLPRPRSSRRSRTRELTGQTTRRVVEEHGAVGQAVGSVHPAARLQVHTRSAWLAHGPSKESESCAISDSWHWTRWENCGMEPRNRDDHQHANRSLGRDGVRGSM